MALTMTLIDIVVMHGYALSGRMLRRVLTTARAVRWQNRVFGGVFVALGVALLFTQRVARPAVAA